MAIPALHVLTRRELAQLAGETQRRLRQHRVERRQTGKQQLHVVDLQRHVVAVADLTLERDATRQRGVPGQADQVDVFRILEEVAARAG